MSRFNFDKEAVLHMLSALDWPINKPNSRNGYRTTPLLSCCVMLYQMATVNQWFDASILFSHHGAHISEIFRESVKQFLRSHVHLTTGPILKPFTSSSAEIYVNAVHSVNPTLQNCIVCLVRTLIGIAKTTDNSEQRAVYNGCKRKHALKFQTFTTPDGLILHGYDPVEGRRYDVTMFRRSGLEEEMRRSFKEREVLLRSC